MSSLAEAAFVQIKGASQSGQHYFVLDELWRGLRSSKGLVDRVEALTRLNRAVGVGQVLIYHTVSDLLALLPKKTA